MSKVLKAVWFVFESVCFAIGLFILINLLTTVVNEGTISIKKNGEQMLCYSTDKNKCVPTLSEEKKRE